MNVQAVHVRMVEHVLMESMGTHVPVLLGTLEQTVEQTVIDSLPSIEYHLI